MIVVSAPEPQLRVAEPADVERIVALVESAYRGEASRAGWTTEAHLLEGQRTDAGEIGKVIDAFDSMMLLAVAGDGELIGCCQLERRDETTAYFGTFAVQPGKQGGGVGKVILAGAERTARQLWSTTTMQLTVISQRADLIAWYERRGYRRTGEQRDFPYGDERFGRPRREDLVFAVLDKDIT